MGHKLIHTVLLLGILLTGGACTKEAAEIPGKPGEGAVSIAFAMPRSRATADGTQYPWNRCTIRIYKYTVDEAGERTKELIRRYNSPTEMPASLWLLAGEYAIAVEAGSRAEATFDEPTYKGEKDFKIVEGTSTSVTVECRVINTLVKVVYDRTIAATFKEKFSTTVAIDETYDQSRVDDGRVANLTYEETKTGYFILPENTTAFSWQFSGKGEKNGEPLELTKTGSKAVTAEAGVCYQLNLKYSPDLGGKLEFTLTVDESVDEIFDPIVFIPNPQIAGDGFEIGDVQSFVEGKIGYRISSIADMKEVQIQVEGRTFAVPASEAYAEDADGIAIDFENATSLRLVLGEKFFSRLSGGAHADPDGRRQRRRRGHEGDDRPHAGRPADPGKPVVQRPDLARLRPAPRIGSEDGIPPARHLRMALRPLDADGRGPLLDRNARSIRHRLRIPPPDRRNAGRTDPNGGLSAGAAGLQRRIRGVDGIVAAAALYG